MSDSYKEFFVSVQERHTHRILLALIDDDFDLNRALAPAPILVRDPASEAALARNLVLTYWLGAGLSFMLIVAWPVLAMPMNIFPKSYFAWWVAPNRMSILHSLLAAASISRS